MKEKYIKKVIYRSGMIPYFYDGNTSVKMLFMKPSDGTYGGNDFQIAKGKVEPDETDEDCAIRESNEEVGVRQENILSVDRVGDYNTYFLGYTSLFVCKLFSDDPEEFDEPSVETEEVCWMTLEEFKKIGRKLHVPLVEAAYDRICLIENI